MTPKKKATLKASLIVLLLMVLLWLPAAAWAGFVFSKLWTWFVVPLGVARIGVWHAAGLMVLCALPYASTLARLSSALDDEDETLGGRCGRAIGTAIFVPAFTLAFGAVYHVLG